MIYSPQYVQSLFDVDGELRKVAQALLEPEPTAAYFQPVYAAPGKPVVGLVVWADGAVWNPGAGAGLYEWRGAAWFKL